MPVQNNPSHGLPHEVQETSDPNGPNNGETYDAANIADERTLAWTEQLDSLPPEDLAAYLWPPSIYEATQQACPTSLPPRQPYDLVDYHTMTVGESWQPSLATASSYPDRTRYLEPPQVNSMDRTDGGNLFALGYPDFGLGSTADNLTPPAPGIANDNENASSSVANDTSSLRCPVCTDKPPFTGQYAQRNLNRHMERHGTCTGTGNNRHIHCGQPECTSTFGREDALLVHLRRSHPELNTPPAKKRKK